MKKIAEKVALVAHICITLVFVITTLLFVTDVISFYEQTTLADGTVSVTPLRTNDILIVLVIVLAVVYLVLSAYLLWVNFSEKVNLKEILLFCDSDSATVTNLKVIKDIVNGCSQQVEGISVKKVQVRADEKGGFVATLTVKANAETVSQCVNKLRCLVTDSFQNALGLTFNTVNFVVKKLNGRYSPNTARAETLAKALQEKQEECSHNYQEPLDIAQSDNDGALPLAENESEEREGDIAN